MNRLVLAGSVVLGTFILGIFAVAIAQRDARNRITAMRQIRPEYATQKPEPLTAAEAGYGDQRVFTQSKPAFGDPLDVPPPLSARSVIRSNDTELESELDANSLVGLEGNEPPNAEGEPEPLHRSANQLLHTLDEATAPLRSQPYLEAAPENPLRQVGDQQPLAPPPLAPRPQQVNQQPGQQPGQQGRSASGGMLAPPSLAPSSGPAPLSAPPSSPYSDPPSMLPPTGSSRTRDPRTDNGPTTLPQSSSNAPLTPPPNPSLNTPPNIPPYTPVATDAGLAPPPTMPALNQATAATGGGSTSPMPPPQSTPYNANSDSSATMGSTLGNQPNRSQGAAPHRGSPRSPDTNRMQWERNANLVNETPGQRLLDGAQNPSLQLQKRAPEEVQVGQPATFTLVVRNVGNATAHDVTVLDRVPRGTRMTRTSPPAQEDGEGGLVWKIGEMPAGAEQTITLELIPETEGEIGSVASVTFASQASVRSISTQPRLEVTQHSESKVLVGESVNIRMQVTNVGTGVARDVWLEEEVPPGMRHPQGAKLELSLGDLAPGESRSIPLELIAAEAGISQNVVRAVATNVAPIDSVGDVEVIAPQLKLAMTSPRMRYVERQFTYQITISNSGTATARNVEMIGYLPKGLRFNNAGNHGEYLSDQHAAVWALEELGPGETATTELAVLPVEEGEYVFRMQASADGVRAEPIEKPIRIEGQSELSFTIDDDNDPIEVDEQTTYTIAISNIGTRSDSQVELAVALPPRSQVIQVNAPVRYQALSDGIAFEPIPEMRSKDRQTFRIVVRLPREGTQVAKAMVKSRLRPVGETKEESTQVYSDR